MPANRPRWRSLRTRFSLSTVFRRAGKRPARVSPVFQAKGEAGAGGTKAGSQLQRMAANRPSLDEEEDMETEMSPECECVVVALEKAGPRVVA